jgi:arylsulfatase A-like enzyme
LGACGTAVAAPWFSQAWAAEQAAPDRPNIVVFLIDDMGWQDTSVAFWRKPTPFNSHYRTPNMERLARGGIRFTNAHAHPVCSPTRVSIMTGHNPARHHVTNWIFAPDKDTSADWGPVASPPGWRMQGLQPGDVTLASLLRDAGYHTIHCGKAHWGAHGTPGSEPLNLGFDVNIAGHAAGAPASYLGRDDYGNNDEKRKAWAVPGLEKYHATDTHLTDALALEAIQALDAAVQTGKPFYLHMAHYAVHVPIQPHTRFHANYENRNYAGSEYDIPKVEEDYASMIEGMDAALGALLGKLDQLGVARNTLVIFTSDNGGLSAHARGTTPRGTGLNTHNWPLKAGKGSAYEGGTRVPFIASWAKPDAGNPLQRSLRIKPGSESDQPVISEDLFPTILGLAEARQLVPAGYPVDGVDMEPLFGKRRGNEERPLIVHYPHVWGPKGPGYEPHSSIRIGKWKAVYFYIPRRWELYDIEHDLAEERDLAARRPKKLRELAARLDSAFIEMNAQAPIDRQTRQPLPLPLP